MCKSNAYIDESGEEILFFEVVNILRPECEKIYYRLKHIENYGGRFFDYFMTTREYEEEVRDAIEAALDDEFLNKEIEGELLVLQRVFYGGKVMMG